MYYFVQQWVAKKLLDEVFLGYQPRQVVCIEPTFRHQIHDDDRDGPRNVGSVQTPNAADSPRRLHRKSQDHISKHVYFQEWVREGVRRFIFSLQIQCLILKLLKSWTRCSSVGIVPTRTEKGFFLSRHRVRSGCGAFPASCEMSTGGKAAGREADR
jgi:hypothetical protein